MVFSDAVHSNEDDGKEGVQTFGLYCSFFFNHALKIPPSPMVDGFYFKANGLFDARPANMVLFENGVLCEATPADTPVRGAPAGRTPPPPLHPRPRWCAGGG